MNAELILRHDDIVHDLLKRHASQRRCVFLTGLPGTGKSLMLQQLALLAHERGRAVHVLQWDLVRTDFDTDEVQRRYPEIDGITHPAIRQAADQWVRSAVSRWHRAHPDANHLLLGEVPLIGGRFVELAQRRQDSIEPVLASPGCVFLITVPTRELRLAIERARARDLAALPHARDAASARLDVLPAQWNAVITAAKELGLHIPDDAAHYDPGTYIQVFAAALRHRRCEPLLPSRQLPVTGSVHDLDVVTSELRPTSTEVNDAFAAADCLPHNATEDWFRC